MKATTYLKKDHATVKELFQEFEQAGDGAHATKKRIFDALRRALEPHMQVEEELLYPILERSKQKEQRTLALEALEEHAIAKYLLSETGDLEATDPHFDAKVKVLKSNVLHHIREEEREVFEEIKTQMAADELEELGRQLEARKEELAARPERRAEEPEEIRPER